MTSYKTIVRGLIKICIDDYMNRHYTGCVSGIRVDSLTISGGICFFEARAVVASFSTNREFTNREFTIRGEVFSSGAIDISCVEEQK